MPRVPIYRHPLFVRLTHWTNFVVLFVMLASGLQIFNAHPALYWGEASTFERPFIAMTAEAMPEGGHAGITTVLGARFETTGVFGLSHVDGVPTMRGFPSWMTLPSSQWLAMGRTWHFFFAWLFVVNGLIYAALALGSGHVRKDLLPARHELSRILRTTWDHIRFRFPHGDEARRYNVLQKLAYLVVIFGLGPIVVLTGLTMSPAMDTAFPWLLDLFGGRQSARTIHFLCAFAFVLFFVVHIVMVLVTGVFNNLRSMITGWYRIDAEAPAHEK